METKHRVIPIFIPQRACPYKCIYCNQFAIAGQQQIPTPTDAEEIIDTLLATMPANAEKRIAFFGGSFTGMTIEEQNAYLQVAHRYVERGDVSGIQLSTRPDYINQQILDNLKQFGVTIIELGAQSLDNEILQTVNRGHSVEDVRESSRLIIENGFQLGLQMMIGLPGDTKEKSLETAREIVRNGASFTRIYPTLVVENTPLAEWYRKGAYAPLTIDEAVDWCKDIYKIFTQNNIQILRIGLHPSEGLLSGKDYLAGPFHVSFKELLLTALWHDKIADKLEKCPTEDIVIEVPRSEINYAVGYQSSNKKAFPGVTFKVIP